MLKGFYFLLIWPYFEAFSGLFEDFGKWLEGRMQRWRTEGFTLIEMSMVLVVIGLLVGGVLFGVDLVKAAETRAQISQVGKYDAAVNTFRNKYNAIPGDMAVAQANQFGFYVPASCTGQQGGRDGNGLIDGYISPWWYAQGTGETALFWEDLSAANFIDQNFSGSLSCAGNTPGLSATPGGNYIGNYLPVAKIGTSTFVYVYEAGGNNWFGLSALTSISGGAVPVSGVSIPVTQAYAIDKKIDDGMPITGKVQALYINGSDAGLSYAPNGNPDTVSTCYNNSTNTYSTNIGNGSNPNCALSFQMQGAAR